jgi:hypothetical protein
LLAIFRFLIVRRSFFRQKKLQTSYIMQTKTSLGKYLVIEALISELKFVTCLISIVKSVALLKH